MNESRTFRDEGLGGPSRPPLGEELLPPVEQPSAKFIIQLFVVPLLIVMSMVGIYLTFTKLLSGTTVGSDKLIEGIANGPSVARWQRAKELADRLQNKGYADLRRNQERATQLAQILDRELQRPTGGKDEQEEATLRFFLAKALGEFDVEEGTDVLLTAATTNRAASDALVRQGALEAIAVRAHNLPRLDPPRELTDPDLEPTLLRLAGDEDPAIRHRTVFALGKLGTPAAIEMLRVLVDDLDADTRYNAALALAHRGDLRSAATLAEMLDIGELAKEVEASKDQDLSAKNTVILASAIDAAHALARQNPAADLSQVTTALDELAHADATTFDAARVPRRVASDAEHALAMLKAKR
jgi:hypothetical protein